MAQLDARPTGDQEVAGSTHVGSATSFVEIDREIFSMVILSLPLIQEEQLSVSGERMYTNTSYPLRGQSLPRKSLIT